MFCDGAKGRGLYNRLARGCYLRIHHDVPCAIPTVGQAAVVRSGSPAAHTDLMGASAIKCWQNDTKTLQCIKLQPWSFKRAEFWHRTSRRSSPGKVQSRLALGGRSLPVARPTTHQASRAHPRQNHPRTSGAWVLSAFVFLTQRARNTLDSARIPRASKLLICGLFQKGLSFGTDGVPEIGWAS